MKNKDEIDELLLKNMIAGDITEETTGQLTEVKPKKKRDYSVFLEVVSFDSRHSVYISGDMYERISLIIRLMGNKLTIGIFINNILKNHFLQYGGEINAIINQQISKLKP